MVYFMIVRQPAIIFALWSIIALSASAIVSAAASPTPSPAPLTDPWLIVPGQSLGLLRLGIAVRALYQLPGWAQPGRTHLAGSISYLTYGRHGVTIAARDESIVMMLTTNERFHTDRGVAVGKPASGVAAAYGGPTAGGDDRTLWYDALGLVVVVGGNTVVRIGVYDPKALVRVILLEERPARDIFLSARQPKFGAAPAATSGAAMKTVMVVITLKNAGRGPKVLNPNFLTLIDRSGRSHRYDPSTFGQKDACRSSLMVRPGDAATCSMVFVIPAGETPRSLVFDDGASVDETPF